MPKGVLHAYENAGDGTGKLFALHMPGGSHERFVEVAGVPATGSGAPHTPVPDPEGFALLAAEHGIEICKGN